ncbi:MAG: phosphoribosylamine--glycine ligase [Akkermansia sp.]|nr:phosphoribosylamine--glycine ligase [Akkermansia sp.]
MKIAVIGKGGREQALVETLAASPCKPEIYTFPGSDAILQTATAIKADGLDGLIEQMTALGIDLCVAGEESYLVKDEGLANRCHAAGIPCWGPTKQSAQLEASKEFAKDFLVRHHIPTGKATAVADYESAVAAIGGQYPTVLKFDGLAAGKGVAVCPDAASAEEFLQEVFIEKRFGEGRLLVEEFLTGPEISIFGAICDDRYLILCPARDYKRLQDGDEGPNTGGMGAVASRQLADADLIKTIEETIVAPTVQGLQKDGLPYRGFLYFGLMLTPQGPKVIEYNCRFGDPECEAVMPLLRGDLANFCFNGAKGEFTPELISFDEGWSVCCILASAGYPASSHSGDVISGLEECQARVFHCGTKKTEAGWVTNGGRVLAIVAQGATLDAARTLAHAEAAKVDFDGSQRRSDIAYKNM